MDGSSSWQTAIYSVRFGGSGCRINPDELGWSVREMGEEHGESMPASATIPIRRSQPLTMMCAEFDEATVLELPDGRILAVVRQ